MHETSDDGTCAVLSGVGVRKMHTSKRDAFKPVNSEQLAKIMIGRDDVKIQFEIALSNKRKDLESKRSIKNSKKFGIKSILQKSLQQIEVLKNMQKCL